MIRKTAVLAALLALTTGTAWGGDDPSIQDPLRSQVGTAIEEFLAERTVDGVYRHYDPVDERLLRLADANIHSGIVRNGDFYVSCADFTDQDGRKVDIDVLVLDAGGEMRAVQGLVHKVDGTKRPFHLDHD